MQESDVKKLQELFATIDTSGDGFVTVAELRKALANAGFDHTLKEIQNIVKKSDKNGDRKLVWEEFLEMMKSEFHEESVKDVERKNVSGEEYSRAMAAFKMFDKSNDGYIDIEELKKAMFDLQIEEDTEKGKHFRIFTIKPNILWQGGMEQEK